MKNSVEYDREAGIKAIIELQKLVGIDEPRDRAERNWDKFSDYDKSNTLAAAQVLLAPNP